MSLQTDLHQAVAQVTADSALLHTIVHGTAAQTVTMIFPRACPSSSSR